MNPRTPKPSLTPVSIICPVYNGDQYLQRLYTQLSNQQEAEISEIIFPLTESSDSSREILEQFAIVDQRIIVKHIKTKDFSHSLTRETAALSAKGKILVFITQDIDIRANDWLIKLIAPLLSGEADASYSRQRAKYNNIEKYTREYNYPEHSAIVSKQNLADKGLKTFFFSDASSAVLKAKFVELKAYDGKKLPINEDMYLAYKIIMSGGKIKYCADSVVYHSHRFKLGEIYNRYKLTGRFFKENSYLNQYDINGAGAKLAKYVLKRILQDKRFDLLLRYPFDMSARFLGMKVGKR